MAIVADLLADIERFCADAAISESVFSRRAANDGKFVRRLREGADVTAGTVDRVRSYIAAERARLGKPDVHNQPTPPTASAPAEAA